LPRQLKSAFGQVLLEFDEKLKEAQRIATALLQLLVTEGEHIGLFVTNIMLFHAQNTLQYGEIDI